MLATYLIGLREGLEAALIVSILVAYLVKTDRREALPFVWAGVGAAVAMSVGVAAILNMSSSVLSDTAEELFAGIMSILAVGLVTWMIFWMKRTSRTIASDLRSGLDRAFAMGVGAVAAMAFVSVAREGLETAVFFFSLDGEHGSGRGPGPRTGPRPRDLGRRRLDALQGCGPDRPVEVLPLHRPAAHPGRGRSAGLRGP